MEDTPLIWMFDIINWLNLKMSSTIWRKEIERENLISGAECARIYDQKLVKMSWRIDFHSTLFSRQQILMNRIWGDEIWIEAVRCCDSWMFSLLLLKIITIMVFLGIGKIGVIKSSVFITSSKMNSQQYYCTRSIYEQITNVLIFIIPLLFIQIFREIMRLPASKDKTKIS